MTTEHHKFRELIVFVARETEDDRSCGATKLNKILFYSDFRAYEQLGQSITGERYQKLEHGPAPRRMVPVAESMAAEGLCTWEERDYFGFPLRKLVPLREPDLSQFSASEIDLARGVIGELASLNAKEVSDLSHRFAGWQATDIGEDIPYATVFVDESRPFTLDELTWALEVVDAYEAAEKAC
ncbi:MAG: Panacea domain-containing protein [Acidobacteriota bacterium]